MVVAARKPDNSKQPPVAMPKLVNPYGLVKVRPQRAPPSAVARYSFLHAPCRHACPRLVAGGMVCCWLQPKTQRYRKPWAEGQADTVRHRGLLAGR